MPPFPFHLDEMIVTTAQLYKVAYGKFAIGAYNINNAEDEANACLTNPDEAVEFIQRSRCDALAAAIGTSHGAYKFKGQQSLHFEVIEAIREKVKAAGHAPVPIVMHGSSSVPKEEV